MLRRDFLASIGAAAAGLWACGPAPRGDRMRILILGGTNFVGPAIVERALARGHEVTLFNRGLTRPELFPSVEKLRGDRNPASEDIANLEGTRRWDAVVDVWPEQSELVERTADLLRDRVDYYFFISSIAVYRSFARPGITETDQVGLDEPGTYGGEKALAERAVERTFPGRSGVARCHAILGPRDDGTAYHYWLRRLAGEEEVLAPGRGADPVQHVDVRDVARWVVDCAERRRPGPHNLCGPAETQPLREFLEGTRAGIGGRARLTWVDADFLRDESGIASFSDMPLWAPLDEDPGFYQISGAKALAAGMTYRPIGETAAAAWAWYRSYFFRYTTFPASGMGISREREEAILAAWRERAGAGTS